MISKGSDPETGRLSSAALASRDPVRDAWRLFVLSAPLLGSVFLPLAVLMGRQVLLREMRGPAQAAFQEVAFGPLPLLGQ